MREYTIIVPDNEVLSCLCGTNDSNLTLIEESLGLPVYTRGNEISIESDDNELCQKFQFIIDRVIDEVNIGGKNTTLNLEDWRLNMVEKIQRMLLFPF